MGGAAFGDDPGRLGDYIIMAHNHRNAVKVECTEPHKRGYLAYVWEAVGRAALEQVLGTAEAKARNGIAGALEEDARLTALFLWTLHASNGILASGELAFRPLSEGLRREAADRCDASGNA